MQHRATGKFDSMAPLAEEGRGSGKWLKPPRTSPGVDQLAERLVKLCRAADLGEKASQAETIFRRLIAPWTYLAEFASGQRGGWSSEISDDNTPIEFSVTVTEGQAEVRVLFEPQGEQNTLRAHRAAALAMHLEVEQEYGASLDRLRAVRDLFLPPDMQGPFALWSAVVFSKGAAPAFKAYCNPQAQGVGKAAALVETALERLGLKRAWPNLTETLLRRGPHFDELKYFALDLSDAPRARVKVYVRHHDASPADLEQAASAARACEAGQTLAFARAMGGGTECFAERAMFTCAAFVGGQDISAAATTQYVPVCAYAHDDATVRQRVAGYMAQIGLDPAPYERLLQAFATRPLDAGVGMQSWVALRKYGEETRLSVYLAAEVRRVFVPGSVPAATNDHSRFASADAALDCLSQHDLREHPFLSRLARATDPASSLLALSRNLAEWTARGRAEGTEAAALRGLQAIARLDHAPGRCEDAKPGRQLAEGLATRYREPVASAADAARLAAGLCQNQILRGVAAVLIQRSALEEPATGGQSSIPPWGNGKTLPEATEAFARAALSVHALFWTFLDQLYQCEFGAPEGLSALP